MENFSNANAHKIVRTTICRYCAKRFFWCIEVLCTFKQIQKNN